MKKLMIASAFCAIGLLASCGAEKQAKELLDSAIKADSLHKTDSVRKADSMKKPVKPADSMPKKDSVK